MKTVVLILFCLVACSSPKRDVAKENVLKYVNQYGNDPKSYEFISLKIDTPRVKYTETPSGQDVYLRILDLRGSLYNDALLQQLTPKEIMDIDSNTRKRMLKEKEDSAKMFVLDTAKGPLVGIHTYRAKNGFGAVMLFNDTIYFDKDYNIKEYINSK